MVNPRQHAGKKQAARFRLVGGPYHGILLTVYAPWDVITFNEGEVRYEIHPPIGKSDEWVYIHTSKLAEGTEQL